MTNQDRVARLESLLERIRRNAKLPRHASAPLAAHLAVTVQPGAEPKPAAAAPVAAPSVQPQPPAPPPEVTAPPPQLDPSTLPPQAAPRAPEPPPVPTPPPAWSAEPPSAVQARPGTLPPEELNEDDLMEVTTLPPAPVAESVPEVAAAGAGTDAPFEDEQAPASSRRSKVAETLDEALSGAAALEQEEEREVPVKTPPPESGPQEALPSNIEAAGVPDVEQLEADLLGPPSMGPTAEQLGETIELDEPLGPQLEIDVAVSAEPEPEPPPEELEVTLPRAPMPSGTYDVAASQPPVNIEISETAEPTLPPAAPHSKEFVPTVPAQHAPPGELVAERTARAPHGATDVARVVLAPASAPKNFVELLDVSLGL